MQFLYVSNIFLSKLLNVIDQLKYMCPSFKLYQDMGNHYSFLMSANTLVQIAKCICKTKYYLQKLQCFVMWQVRGHYKLFLQSEPRNWYSMQFLYVGKKNSQSQFNIETVTASINHIPDMLCSIYSLLHFGALQICWLYQR